jgi:hypothetical protein
MSVPCASWLGALVISPQRRHSSSRWRPSTTGAIKGTCGKSSGRLDQRPIGLQSETKAPREFGTCFYLICRFSDLPSHTVSGFFSGGGSYQRLPSFALEGVLCHTDSGSKPNTFSV